MTTKRSMSFGVFYLRVFDGAFGDNKPAGDIDEYEGKNDGHNRGKDKNQANDRRVDMEHFTHTAADAGDF